MIVAIHQPNYLPWFGFFNKMMNSDVFVLLDNVKHSKRSFTHRNIIKANDKELLLSIPLINKESIINELLIFEPEVNISKHWRAIQTNYRKANNWEFLSEELESIFNKPWSKLVDLNIEIIKLVKEKLNIKTEIIIASELKGINGEGSERNMDICQSLGAKIYLSGAGAKAYNDENAFNKKNIKIVYNNFKHPTYPQIGNNFLSKTAIIDLLFNCGPDSKEILASSGSLKYEEDSLLN